MRALDQLIESRIREAREQGAFDDLPGTGRPLSLDDDLLVPQEVRAANRVLKNAGYVPPEVEHLREIGRLERELAAVPSPAADSDDLERGARRARARRRLAMLMTALEARGVDLSRGAGGACRRALVERLLR